MGENARVRRKLAAKVSGNIILKHTHTHSAKKKKKKKVLCSINN